MILYKIFFFKPPSRFISIDLRGSSREDVTSPMEPHTTRPSRPEDTQPFQPFHNPSTPNSRVLHYLSIYLEWLEGLEGLEGSQGKNELELSHTYWLPSKPNPPTLPPLHSSGRHPSTPTADVPLPKLFETTSTSINHLRSSLSRFGFEPDWRTQDTFFFTGRHAPPRTSTHLP